MKSKEMIMNICKRFSNLVHDLKGLGKRFKIIELVKKSLRFLPKSWTMKVTIIEESKDLSKMRIYKLIESLLIYKMKRKLKEEEVKA